MRPAVPLLGDLLTQTATRLPQKIALICGSERISFADLAQRAFRLACELREGGIVRGDRVVILGGNDVSVAVAFWGTLYADAIPVLVGDATKAARVIWIANDCAATAVIADGNAEGCTAALGALAHVRMFLVFGQPSRQHGQADVERCFETALGDRTETTAPPVQAIDIDLAALIYTSGSTGEPKGVMVTHRNMLTAAASICAYLDLREDDVIQNVMPLSFDYGLYQMLMACRQGATLVLERSFLLPIQVVRHAHAEGVTVFPGVPTMFALLGQLQAQAAPYLSGIRVATTSGAALSDAVVAAMPKLFPNARIYSMFGLTECKRCTYLPPEDFFRKPSSIGIAIPNTEIWVVDEQDRRLGPNEVGQLVIRGATVMRGYWGQPDATRQKLRPGPLPGEMVLYTGDLCRFDDEGYLYFVSRTDDVIKSRGEKVPLREIELALSALPGVREAVVIGVPDALAGHMPKAYVVLEAGSLLTPPDLRVLCEERLAASLVPREIVVVASLPRSPNGKISKKDLA